jgi:hypothetical protein
MSAAKPWLRAQQWRDKGSDKMIPPPSFILAIVLALSLGGSVHARPKAAKSKRARFCCCYRVLSCALSSHPDLELDG